MKDKEKLLLVFEMLKTISEIGDARPGVPVDTSKTNSCNTVTDAIRSLMIKISNHSGDDITMSELVGIAAVVESNFISDAWPQCLRPVEKWLDERIRELKEMANDKLRDLV